MGRKSTKEDKNVYQISREKMGLTREEASEKLDFISSDRIEKIEYEKTHAHPDEVLKMAEVYCNPMLCNYYCSEECEIGQKYVPKIAVKDLPSITLEMLATLNSLTSQKNRLIEIAVDGEISEDELADFNRIRNELERMSLAIDSLKLFVEQTIASGKIDKSSLIENVKVFL